MSCCTGGPSTPDAPGATTAAVHKGARELTDLAVLGRGTAVLAPAAYTSPLRGQENRATTTACPPSVPLRL
jgi:hypothetical protein